MNTDFSDLFSCVRESHHTALIYQKGLRKLYAVPRGLLERESLTVNPIYDQAFFLFFGLFAGAGDFASIRARGSAMRIDDVIRRFANYFMIVKWRPSWISRFSQLQESFESNQN